jgi:hypothetical protein
MPGIIHGDYQFANVMYAHGTPARLAAIVDWEMGTVGDPEARPRMGADGLAESRRGARGRGLRGLRRDAVA